MTKITIDKALLEQAINTLGYYASVCGEDDQDTPAKQAQTALRAALAEPAVGPVAKAMTAHRAAYFMERFKKEEKLLGPNEQAAVDFVIDMLTATHTAPPPPAVESDAAYKEAKYLAEALFKKHYARDECYASGRVEWSLCDSTAGIISQIDNMVSVLVRPPAEHSCKWPTCQTEKYQQDLADQLARELIGTPANVPMLTDEEFESIRKTCAYQFAEACRSGTTKAKTIMQATEAAVRQKAGL